MMRKGEVKMGRPSRRLLWVRAVLCVLIVLNMAVIFAFSAQSGEESGRTSGRVTRFLASIAVSDFEEMSELEQEQVIEKIHPFVRKWAHMAEFGSLGALILLLLITWHGRILGKWLISLGCTFLYACTDELHQLLSEARGAQFSDVLIDTCGALITCSCILLIDLILSRKKGKHKKAMNITHYAIQAPNGLTPRRIVVASDLHGERRPDLPDKIRAQSPDLILIPGDLMDDEQLRDEACYGYEFLRACAEIAPTFYSVGNHEIACYHKGNPWRHPTPIPIPTEIKEQIAKTGATLLDNEIVAFGDLSICGMTSGINGHKNEPDAELLERFARCEGYRILLCHHPEYFVPLIQNTDIELTVCGHAHGGQWRVFGRGVYAPGQGIFPKYTSGVLDGRCVISRGLGNHTHIPRFFNPRELVVIEVQAQEKK